MGGGGAIAFKDKYRLDNITIRDVGIKQVSTFGAPIVAGNVVGNNKQPKI